MTKEDFRNSKVELVEAPEIEGDILMMYSNNPEDGNSYPLMYTSEEYGIKKGVKDLCEKHNIKRVLEIGYGLGYTAQQFQDSGVTKHTIVEAHPHIYAKASKWAKGYDNVGVFHSFIQDYKYDENDYDLIYDDRAELVDKISGDILFPNWRVIN